MAFLPVSAPRTHLRGRYRFEDSNLQSIVNASMELIATNFSLQLWTNGRQMSKQLTTDLHQQQLWQPRSWCSPSGPWQRGKRLHRRTPSKWLRQTEKSSISLLRIRWQCERDLSASLSNKSTPRSSKKSSKQNFTTNKKTTMLLSREIKTYSRTNRSSLNRNHRRAR